MTTGEQSHLLPRTQAQLGPQLQLLPHAQAEVAFVASDWHPHVHPAPMQDEQLQLLVLSDVLVMFKSSHVKGIGRSVRGSVLRRRLRLLNTAGFMEELAENLQRARSERAY